MYGSPCGTSGLPRHPFMFSDSFGRDITYLRVSVTDRCNFRCQYCMPEDGVDFEERQDLLTADEIEEVVGIFVDDGVRKVRLTGGEPLLRPELPEIVDRLTDLDDLEHVAITTNGYLLGRKAEALADAGLDSLNVSLDSLDDEMFEELTRLGDLERVLDGIETARDHGLTDLKLNTVVVGGYNDHELEDLANFAIDRGLILRFIEFMPLGDQQLWDGPGGECVPANEIRSRLSERWTLESDSDSYGAGPARYMRLHGPNTPDEGHPLGIIGAVTECFCDDCNRMRITATGQVRACLADDHSLSVRAPLRTYSDTDERRRAIESVVQRALGQKDRSHDFDLEGSTVTDTTMSQIGG